jgi:hypothetical protein
MKRSLDAGLKGHRPVLVSDSPSWNRDSPSIPQVVVSRSRHGPTVISSCVILIIICRDGEEEEILSSGQVSPICKFLFSRYSNTS